MTFKDLIELMPPIESINKAGRAPWLFDQVSALKTRLGRPPLCAEIGVWCGYTSLAMVAAGGWVIAVDPFDGRDVQMQERVKSIGGTSLERFIANTFFLGLPGQVLVIADTSRTAVRMIPNESLDLVFVDGEHEYPTPLIDFVSWEPKIRPGGILCGHDLGQDGVHRSIEGFCQFRGWPRPRAEGNDDTWIVEKPQ